MKKPKRIVLGVGYLVFLDTHSVSLSKNKSSSRPDYMGSINTKYMRGRASVASWRGGGILKLEAGRELDALVAEKVFSWKYFKTNNPFDYFKEDNKMHDMVETGKDGVFTRVRELPNFSTDTAAAWMVVERMLAKRYTFKLFASGNKSVARFLDNGFVVGSGCSDFVPLAICLAALKALGVDIEKEAA